jgi:alpha,alpha-trehalose phosphorylase
MLKREVVTPPEHLFPPDEWRLVEARWSSCYAHRAETVFAVGNGFLGVRGTLEEGRPAGSPGTFVGGFHETWPMTHAESAYGLVRTGQTIVNVPDATVLQLYVDDEPLYLPTARTPEYQRVLDLRDGILCRDLVWSLGSGKHIRVSSWRMVSLEDRHLLAMQLVVTPLDHDAAVVVASRLVNRQDAPTADRTSRDDPRLSRVFPGRVLECELADGADRRMAFGYRTGHSGMTLGVGVDHVVVTDSPWRTELSLDGDLGELVLTVDAAAGSPVTITKYVTYHSSRGVPAEELVARAARALDRAVAGGTEPTSGSTPGGIPCGRNRRSGGTSSRWRRPRGAPKVAGCRPRV